jgi:hypothetical protein
MGFNTTVVVLNDALHDIENDPDFGKNLAKAVRGLAVRDGYQDVPALNHVNAATVIESHHADSLKAVLVGGNIGIDLGYAGHYSLDLATFAAKKGLLKVLADHLGVSVAVGPVKRRR